MRLIKSALFILTVLLLTSCSSTRLVNQWHNPETPVYAANKVLVIGMSADDELRGSFEEQLKNALEEEGVSAVRSIDFFETSFTDQKTAEKDLEKFEYTLLEAGFDVILISKITGTESKVSMVRAMRGFNDDFMNFKDYYYSNQQVYSKAARESHKVYHTETSAFCICPGKERELLWRGQFDIVDPYSRKRNVVNYVNVLIRTLGENQMLIVP